MEHAMGALQGVLTAILHTCDAAGINISGTPCNGLSVTMLNSFISSPGPHCSSCIRLTLTSIYASRATIICQSLFPAGNFPQREKQIYTGVATVWDFSAMAVSADTIMALGTELLLVSHPQLLWGAKVEFNAYLLILKKYFLILEIHFLIFKNEFLILENDFLILENRH